MGLGIRVMLGLALVGMLLFLACTIAQVRDRAATVKEAATSAQGALTSPAGAVIPEPARSLSIDVLAVVAAVAWGIERVASWYVKFKGAPSPNGVALPGKEASKK